MRYNPFETPEVVLPPWWESINRRGFPRGMVFQDDRLDPTHANAKAVVWRYRDGSWGWKLFVRPRRTASELAKYPYCSPKEYMRLNRGRPAFVDQGREPTRLHAIEHVDRAVWGLDRDEVMFHGGPMAGEVRKAASFRRIDVMPVCPKVSPSFFAEPMASPAATVSTNYRRRGWHFILVP